MEMTSEFIPLENFKRILQFWWLVVLLAIAGGIAGFIIHRQKPPLYEAKAVFFASIDFNKILPPYNLTQYDEDVSLTIVEWALRQSTPTVSEYVLNNNLLTDPNILIAQTIIERKNSFWELRFRYKDPAVAQNIVNYWAQQAFASLQAWQEIGQVPPYVYFDLVQLADLPDHPVYFETNNMVLAGSLIGLVVGVLVVNLPFIRVKKKG